MYELFEASAIQTTAAPISGGFDFRRCPPPSDLPNTHRGKFFWCARAYPHHLHAIKYHPLCCLPRKRI